MTERIELTREQLMLAFAASCIEGAARRLGVGSAAMAARMRRAHVIEDFVLPFYEELHTESREHVTNDVVDYLLRKEQEQ